MAEVRRRREHDGRILPELADAAVAVPAQEPAHDAGRVIMIDDEEPLPLLHRNRLPRVFGDFADSASALLPLIHLVVVADSHAVRPERVTTACMRIKRHLRTFDPFLICAWPAPVLVATRRGSQNV